MRYVLILLVILGGWHVGQNAINKMEGITNQRNAQLCEIDPTLCQSKN